MKQTLSAQFKATPQDFIVTELLPISNTLSEQGEHLWLYLQKTGVNTAHLAKLLAQWAKIPIGDVGYSGLKDRNAVTYQWFSLRLPKLKLDTNTLSPFLAKHLNGNESVELIKHHRHHKKLQRGTHKFNHFCLTLKNITGDALLINHSLQQISKIGVPNFFGTQRFGRDAGNITQAQAYFNKIIANPKYRHKDKNKHALLVSVARSDLFNQILTQRVAQNNWHTPIAGDVFRLRGSNSLFCADIDTTIKQRVATGDIYPTGILFGKNDTPTTHSTAHAIEQAVLNAPANHTLTHGLTLLNIKASRRSLVLPVEKLSSEWLNADTLMLDFILPTGAFATTVLAEIFGQLQDLSLAQ